MEEQTIAVTCHEFALLVERALIAEVELSPKPGLVDALNTGTHTDMNHELFLISAKTLTPFFEEMALVSWNHPMTQTIREKIGEIGRRAEAAMFQATDGVNTHKGAIWAMGLFITAVSSQYSLTQQLFLPKIFSDIQILVSFPDRFVEKNLPLSHGEKVKKKYGNGGAFAEAAAGFPHVQVALSDYFNRSQEDSTEKRLHMLLAIIASLDDTCILYRSDQTVLAQVQSLARKANEQSLPNKSFEQLHTYCQTQAVSPGGSADLLAASFFLLSLEHLTNKTVLFAAVK
ncbi:MAG: triphosphoribosyl-dephospho-CoA synthase [Enterococcus sp.]|uniref:triphosphoribosyl-dephospho-CoA synthase n=1 Tax=Enterococcus sp. TaxID=35783 RepID=UPI002FCC0047